MAFKGLHDDINLEENVTAEELEVFKNGKKEDNDDLFSDEENLDQVDTEELRYEATDLITEFEELEKDIETDERKNERRETINKTLTQINKGRHSNRETVTFFLRGISLIFMVAITVILGIFAYTNHTELYKHVTYIDNHDGNIIVSNDNEMDYSSEISIRSMDINGTYTIFYLKNLDNYNDYYASLVDNMGNYYSLDTHYTELFGDRGLNMLAFEPLKDGVKDFVVTVKNPDTGVNYFEKVFVLNEPIVDNIPQVYFKTEETNNLIELEYAEFLNEATILGYSLRLNEQENVTYNVGDNFNSNKIYLTNDKDYIPPKSNHTYMHDYTDFLSSENAFAQIKDESESLEMSFESIVKIIDINKIINTTDLVHGDEVILELPSYNIVFEGFKRYKNTAVLVYYIQDENDYTSGLFERKINDEYPDKSNGELDVTLDFVKDGRNIQINPSKNIHEEIGGEIVFIDDRLRDTSYDDMNIIVKSASIDEPLYTVEVSKEVNNNPEIEDAIKNIKTGFNERRKYAAGVNIISNVPYFTKDVLYDEDLLEQYHIIEDASKVYFGSSIVSMAQDNGKIYAIVNETGQYDRDGNFYHFNMTHEIIYDINSKSIIQDKIIL